MASLRLAAAVLLVVVPPVLGLAQTAGPGTGGSRFHLRGRPLPECHSFLITEVGAHYLFNEKGSYSGKRSALLTYDGGYMHNIGTRHAAGLVIHLGADDRREDLGLGLRYRRWLRGNRSLNLTGGLGLAGASDAGGTADLSGVTVWGEAGISFSDYATVTLRVQDWRSSSIEFLPTSIRRGDETTVHLGCKVGGLPGAVLLGITGLFGGPPGLSAD
jgi:hypothetical protein